MKNYLLFISLLTLLVGCDAPQRTRTPTNWVNGSSLSDPANTSGTFTPSGTVAGDTGTVPTTTGSTVGTPGFENCNLADKYHTIDIGFFGICQSTQVETTFMFRPSLTANTVRTCLIPTYKDQNGASTYIGNPQCTYTESNKVVTGTLYKDRPGFGNYPLNGVIVMKEPLLPEYINCMQGYVNWPGNACPGGASTSYCSYWLPRCPQGGRSNAACDAEARNYMGNICNAFKTKYSNSYIDIRTR